MYINIMANSLKQTKDQVSFNPTTSLSKSIKFFIDEVNALSELL